MDNSTDRIQDGGAQDQPAPGGEQQHAGNSGEGAASALAHLKSQGRQYRGQVGDADDAANGPRE